MSKERIILKDGVVDISGPYIVYTQKEPGEEVLPTLPYTLKNFAGAKPPAKFLRFLSSIFPDNKTAETVLYYLSLILSKNTAFKYGGIFIGGHETGKTTLVQILSDAVPGYINFFSIPIFSLAPGDLSRMDGMGAAIIQEIDIAANIYTDKYKMLTGGDTLTAKRSGGVPYQFTPTAQIILVCNHFPRFTEIIDEALAARIVIIPFLIKHRQGDPETMTYTEIKKDLRVEYPAIIKLLAEYYIRLKHNLNGVIPLSKQCQKMKKEYFSNSKPFDVECEHCQEHFHAMDTIIENDGLHCPYCGSVMTQVQAHVSRRGK
jgi:phage/plasmid-associated DNA primase